MRRENNRENNRENSKQHRSSTHYSWYMALLCVFVLVLSGVSYTYAGSRTWPKGTTMPGDTSEIDAINGIVVSDGSGNYSAATAGTDYDKPGVVPTAARHSTAFSTLTDDSTSPNVSASDRWLCSNSNPTTITSFPGGTAGDHKFIKFTNGNTTVDFSGTTLKGNHGVDVTFNSGEYLNMTFDGTNWDCTIYHNALPVTSFSDTVTIHDDGDSTKCSGITAGNTRTITPPDANTTIPIYSAAESACNINHTWSMGC